MSVIASPMSTLEPSSTPCCRSVVRGAALTAPLAAVAWKRLSAPPSRPAGAATVTRVILPAALPADRDGAVGADRDLVLGGALGHASPAGRAARRPAWRGGPGASTCEVAVARQRALAVGARPGGSPRPGSRRRASGRSPASAPCATPRPIMVAAAPAPTRTRGRRAGAPCACRRGRGRRRGRACSPSCSTFARSLATASSRSAARPCRRLRCTGLPASGSKTSIRARPPQRRSSQRTLLSSGVVDRSTPEALARTFGHALAREVADLLRGLLQRRVDRL